MSNRLEILKVRGRNFLSIGTILEFDFASHKGLNYIYGQNNDIKTKSGTDESEELEEIRNGSGKSTVFVDLLCYALFDRVPREITKCNISNRRHKKACVVEAWLKSGDKYYYIRNGITPNLYELWEHDEPIGEDYTQCRNISKASPRETAAYVRQNIIKSSYKIFMNTNILCVTDHKSIYQLSKADKRKLIEQLFSVTLFGEIFTIVKQEILQIEKLVVQGRQMVITLERRMQDLQTRHKTFEQDKERKLAEILNEIDAKEIEIGKLKDSCAQKGEIEKKSAEFQRAMQELIEEQKQLHELSTKYSTSLAAINGIVTKNEALVNAYKTTFDTVCSSCVPKLKASLNIDISQLQAETDKAQKEISELVIAIQQNKDTLKESLSDYNQANNELLKAQLALNEIRKKEQAIAAVESSIAALDNVLQSESARVSQFEELAAKDKTEFDATMTQLNEHEKRIKYLDALRHIYSEQGVKNFVIGPLIRTLNNMIQSYLLEMGSEYTVMIDPAFNFKFVTVSGDCEYGNFSAGERRRIDIATILALRDLLMMRGLLECNVLICDEILDVSIDNYCMNVLLEKLKSISEKQNVFLISHRQIDETSNLFDTIIRVDKTNGCTHIGLDTSRN